MEHHPKHQEIAIVSGFLIIISFSQLLFKVYRTKETKHLTYAWIFTLLSAQILYIIYGLLNKAYGIYLPAFIMTIGLFYILYIKVNYDYSINEFVEKELKDKSIL